VRDDDHHLDNPAADDHDRAPDDRAPDDLSAHHDMRMVRDDHDRRADNNLSDRDDDPRPVDDGGLDHDVGDHHVAYHWNVVFIEHLQHASPGLDDDRDDLDDQVDDANDGSGARQHHPELDHVARHEADPSGSEFAVHWERDERPRRFRALLSHRRRIGPRSQAAPLVTRCFRVNATSVPSSRLTRVPLAEGGPRGRLADPDRCNPDGQK